MTDECVTDTLIALNRDLRDNPFVFMASKTSVHRAHFPDTTRFADFGNDVVVDCSDNFDAATKCVIASFDIRTATNLMEHVAIANTEKARVQLCLIDIINDSGSTGQTRIKIGPYVILIRIMHDSYAVKYLKPR